VNWGVDAYRYDPVGRLLEHIDPAGKISRFVTGAAGNHLRMRIREPKREIRRDYDTRLDAWWREGRMISASYASLRSLDLRDLDDDAVNAWTDRYSPYELGRLHGLDHVIRETGMVAEYFFSRDFSWLFKL